MSESKPSRKSKEAADEIHPVSRLFLWVEKPAVHSIFLIFLGIASFGLGALDFVHHRHEYVDWAEWHGFYAWFGFSGFSLAVLTGWPLRKLIGRPEDYYEKAAGDD
jgi:hypothetical protein